MFINIHISEHIRHTYAPIKSVYTVCCMYDEQGQISRNLKVNLNLHTPTNSVSLTTHGTEIFIYFLT